jgi:hypothetical protein
MASRFCDSFEHYTTAQQMARKWTLTSAATIVGGRNGRCAQLGPGSSILKTLTPQTGWTVGWAYQFPGLGGFGQGVLYSCGAIGGGHALATLATLTLEQDGTLSLYGGNASGTLIGHTTFSLSTQIWFYIEVQTSFSGTTPISVTATLKVNGNQLLTGTASTGINAADIIGGSFSGANWHDFGTTNGLAAQLIDDLYIVDGTGAINNTFLGDMKIFALYAASDTATIQWTPSAAGTHFSLVNEAPPDDDTTYVKSNTLNQIDLYNWQPLSAFTGTIPFVHYNLCVRKDDEGTRSFQPVVSGVAQTTTFYPSDEYNYFLLALDKDPATGLAWTVAQFNVDQHGIKLIS